MLIWKLPTKPERADVIGGKANEEGRRGDLVPDRDPVHLRAAVAGARPESLQLAAIDPRSQATDPSPSHLATPAPFPHPKPHLFAQHPLPSVKFRIFTSLGLESRNL